MPLASRSRFAFCKDVVAMELEPKVSAQVCRRCRSRALEISLPREKAMVDAFGTGMCAYYLWADGDGWIDRKKDTSPLGLCFLLCDRRFLQ